MCSRSSIAALKRNGFRLIFGVLCLSGTAFGQLETEDETTALSASGLLSEATRRLSAENYSEAIPFLTGYLERMNESEDVRVRALKQEVRLKLGKTNGWLGDAENAILYLNQYMEQLPRYRPCEALKLLAVHFSETADYEACVATAKEALARPLPQGLKEETKKVNVDELSKEELGGFSARQLKRLEEDAEEAEETGDDLSEGFSTGEPDPEPDFTNEELLLLHMTLAEACAALEDWEASLGSYQFVIDHAEKEDRRGYAGMQMVHALIGLERFQEAGSFITQLYKTPARYDIRVNMALMTAASALVEQQEYVTALRLYRRVLPREELVGHQTEKMNEIRRYAGLPDVKVSLVTNDVGRIETLFGHKYAEIRELKDGTVSQASLPVKPMELIMLEEATGALMSLPPYEQEVIFRIGKLFASAGRPWEAVAALSAVADRDLASEMGQRAFYESLRVLTDPLAEYDWVETRGLKFLETVHTGLGARQVAHVLTGAYQKQGKMQEIKNLLPIIQWFEFSDDAIIQQLECELYYMQAVADLVLLNYKEAEAGFRLVLTKFPRSHQEDNATYWHAMSLLFLQDYEKALTQFEAYPVNSPRGNWLDSIDFRCGICLFGLERYEEAEARFTEVIDTYKQSAVYPDACSMRGDLRASKALLKEAQADYEEAISTARNVRQATYAVFQMAAMFELESRYDEVIAAVNIYLDRYNEEADVAKAAYWIGKTKLAQGLTGEALAAYRDAIVRYGGNTDQEGVDLIITELANVAKRLEEAEADQLKNSVQADLAAAESETLRLRLRVLLAKMDGTEIELGNVLIAELDDLSLAPPPVLSVICSASFAAQDYSRSDEILKLFQTRYDSSDFMRAAFKLNGFALFSAGDLDGAMKMVTEAQGLYGTDFDVSWAQILKGRIELLRDDYEAARKTFRAVLSVRGWRGVPYAEATYYLGEVEEKSGDPRKAFGWYQRVYFQYKGHAEGAWAAEGYLASARCLSTMGLENDRRNTYRAMLFDTYVNQLPQADEARAVLGADEVMEINQMLTTGTQTNVTVTIDAEGAE